MATIEDAVKAKVLEPYELPDWESRLPIRRLWVACEFWDWFNDKRELHDLSKKVGKRTLGEHIEQMLCEFRCAERFPAGDLRQMMPASKGIRKMHPAELRIYGWCPAPHEFVVVAGALEHETKTDKRLNDKIRDHVLAFVKLHKLEHTIVRGDIRAVFPQNR